jgi:hypothetical protein
VLWAAAFGAVLAGLMFLLAHRALTDDAYITLSYARNLAFHAHWGLTEFRTSNTATSPLNVWLLAALIVVVRAPVEACGLLLMVVGAALGAWSVAIARTVGASWVFPAATIGALLVNPFLVSTIGLESYGASALIVGLVRYAIAGRAWATGVVAGLLVLMRPDLVVVDAVVILGVAALRRKVLHVGAMAMVVALPWHVFSWFALGSAVPDTFAFKTIAGRFEGSGATLVTALVTLYGPQFTLATMLSVLPPAVGLGCLLWWTVKFVRWGCQPGGRVAVRFGAAGLAHWAVLALVVQAEPYSWYYAPLFVGLTMTATVTVGIARVRWADVSAAVVVAGTLSCLVLKGGPVPWTLLPVHGNWGTSQQYAQAGQQLNLPFRSTVASPGEVGTLAYFCHCDIVDWLSDRGLGRDYLEQRERVAGPAMRILLRLNYRNLPDVPPAHADYQLTLAPGEEPEALASWALSSPSHGDQRLVLTR